MAVTRYNTNRIAIRARENVSWMDQLGLVKHRKLTKMICDERVKILRSNIGRNVYVGELRKKAMFYANWYGWLSRKWDGSRANYIKDQEEN